MISMFLALAFPLISFLVCFLISEKYSWVVTFVAPFLLLISLLSAGIVFLQVWNEPAIALEWEWFRSGNQVFSVGVLLNDFSVLMLVIVTMVSFLVHLYSIGYMAGDTDIRRYFAMLGFFTFAMLGIVLSGNLLLIFIFWELVGFSSYMLIGHFNEKPQAADAAKRAFIFNRIGDAGFLVGLMILWTQYGTFNLVDLEVAKHLNSWDTLAAIGIFCGVAGKSAQFPLFPWLPAAMEGPTPVSALIHAATMVAAGVFLLARVFFLFTPASLDVVIVTGCVTALAGALAALFQYDIKRILAYSTMSQLGLMVMAIGAGSPEAAMLHLCTHAFFKGCLFLSAGSVIHSLDEGQQRSHSSFDVQDIRNLGGLRRKLPFTFVISVVSGCALAGIPFFNGFVSKEAIFHSLFLWQGDNGLIGWIMFLSAFVVSFITVLYAFRLIWNVFMGEERSTRDLDVVESPPVMQAPMVILAAGCIWLTVAVDPFDFSGWLYNGLQQGKHFHFNFLSYVSALWILFAVAVAYSIRRRSIKSNFLLHGFYFDRFLNRLFEIPVLQLSDTTMRMDKKWIDGILHTAAYVQLIIAHVTGWVDRIVVDGTVMNVARLSKSLGSFTRSFQGGKIQLYIFWAAFAIIIFIIWNLF